MSIYNVGRVCVKLAGRDAGLKCVVVEEIDANFVLVDGQTRRRKINIRHLEPLEQTVDLKSGADTSAVAKALGIEIKAKKSKKPAARPTKQRKVKAKAPKAAKKEKKAEPKKEAKKEKAKEEPKVEEKPATKEPVTPKAQDNPATKEPVKVPGPIQ